MTFWNLQLHFIFYFTNKYRLPWWWWQCQYYVLKVNNSDLYTNCSIHHFYELRKFQYCLAFWDIHLRPWDGRLNDLELSGSTKICIGIHKFRVLSAICFNSLMLQMILSSIDRISYPLWVYFVPSLKDSINVYNAQIHRSLWPWSSWQPRSFSVNAVSK